MRKKNIDFRPKKDYIFRPKNDNALIEEQETIVRDINSKSEDSNFYYVTDIMKIFDVSKPTAYKILKKLNSDISTQNSAFPMRVSKESLNKKLYRCKEN